jgi:hypothetical protein
VDKFDQFDFVAYLAPGALILISYGVLWPPGKLSYGDATIAVAFAITSYVLGHICAAVGVAAWRLYRKWRGLQLSPRISDEGWLTPGLDRGQWSRFVQLIRTRLCRPLITTDALDPEWWNLARQIYADVAAKGGAKRLDAYTRLLNFYRAFQVALIVIALMVAIKAHQSGNTMLLLWAPLGAMAAACSWQIREYDGYYTRELIQRFLLLPLASPDDTT